MAYRADDARAGDAHMRLSALHLGRAVLLQQVQREAVGNVIPLRPILAQNSEKRSFERARSGQG